MKLFTYFRSSAAYRVRIGLNLKGLDWEPDVVWLTKGEQSSDDYRSVNPHGLVPTLVEGEHALGQSLAILEYLDETHPQPPLLPADPVARAQVRAVTLADICLVPQVFNAQRFNLDMSAYPNVMRINEACLALPAFASAQPGEQAEAAQA